MDTKSFDLFNMIVLYLLIQLFENFPKPIDIDAKSLGLNAIPKKESEREGEVWNYMNLAGDTVTWLQKEGFIEVHNVAYGSNYMGVRLTLKGLTLLGYTPLKSETNDKLSTLAEEGKKVLLEGTREGATEVVKQLFISSLRYIPQAF